MNRVLLEIDKLYLDFIANGSEVCLNKIVKEVNIWLYEIIYSSLANKDLSKDVLKQVWSEFIAEKGSYDLSRYSIDYYLYLIAVKIIGRQLNENVKEHQSNASARKQAVY